MSWLNYCRFRWLRKISGQGLILELRPEAQMLNNARKHETSSHGQCERVQVPICQILRPQSTYIESTLRIKYVI